MASIEYILFCLALPLLLSTFFLKGKQRLFSVFFICGMTMCLLAAYVNSFFMSYYNVDTAVAAANITPVCEELMKLLPMLFYIFVWEPDNDELVPAAISIAAGFTTFENCCYIVESGTADLSFIVVRALSAGSVHLLCGIAMGCGLRFVRTRKRIALTGITGVLGAAVAFHATYNLLITAGGAYRTAGFIMPSAAVIIALILKAILPKRESGDS